MKKIICVLLSLVMLVSIISVSALAAGSYEGKTVILYTGNVRGDLSVYPKIKAIKDDYEAAGAEVILVDAGNYLQGTAAANRDRGLTVYTVMDAVGYDVAAMGLAEFSYTDATTGYIYHGNVTKYYTQAQLQDGCEATTYKQGNGENAAILELAAKSPATFKTVSANVTASDVYSFDESATVTTKSGLTVTFYGITDPSVSENIQDNYVLVTELNVPDTESDFTVCLSNASVSGGTLGDIAIDVSSGDFSCGAYVIDNATKEVSFETLTLSKSDDEISALVSTLSEGAESVGTSTVILNGADSMNRNQETNAGDLVTDALLWYAENYIDGLDKSVPLVAIQNGGNIDNFIYTGEITETDLLRAFPFSPMGIGVLYVTGAELLETLEAACQKESCAGFAQVAGLTYTIDTSATFDAGEAYGKFFEADSINRVTITSVNGAAFDPDATYAVVADNYIFNGGDTYYTLKNAKSAEDAVYINNGSGTKTRDVVALYIKNVLGGTIGEQYGKAQGRITIKAQSFSDVSDTNWALDAINWASSKGYMNGVGDNKFDPNGTVSRAMLVTILYRLEGKPVTTGNAFSDVPSGQWYTAAVNWAAQVGIVKGYGDNKFGPLDSITREEAALILHSYSVYKGYDVSATGDLTAFPDAGDTATWAKDAMVWAVGAKLLGGTGSGTISPTGTADRAQIATILMRYCSEVAK
jgi:2',3'-cyclic-nucleotide 2'-phosphodiesterase (5'-nucleotidase family)